MTIVVTYIIGLLVFAAAGMGIFCLSNTRADRKIGAALFFLGAVWPLALLWFIGDMALSMYRELRRK